MRKTNFIKVSIFEEKYNLRQSHVSISRCQGSLPDNIFRKESVKNTFIDESFFTRRLAFKKKVIDACHGFFYAFVEYASELLLSRLLSAIDSKTSQYVWTSYMQRELFASRRDNVMGFKVNKMMWKFYRYCRWLWRGLFIILDKPLIDRDVNVLLDRF